MTASQIATRKTTRNARTARPITDQRRFQNVFDALASRRIAFWFDLRGSRYAVEDRYNDYIRAAELIGTDLWVGEHVGHVDNGGARWGADGVLYFADGHRCLELLFSHNHEYPHVAWLLVALLREQGLDATWSGEPFDAVCVDLEADRLDG